MSTENRLRRLGLDHLADKPEELRKELSKQVASIKAREAELKEELRQKRLRLQAEKSPR
jgi:hypothetical protein